MANDNPDGTLGNLSGRTPWLLIAAAGVLAGVCIWAETYSRMYLAQGTFIGILLLLAVVGVDWWRRHKENRVVPPELATLYQALGYLLMAFAIGIIAVIVVAVGHERWQQGIVAKSMGTGILFAGGTFALGMLLGFLFGFPAASSGSAPQPGAQPSGAPPQGQTVQAGGGPAAPHPASVFRNTNLHEISDWLTKVIVGAGLVDLTRLPPQAKKLAWFMAQYTDHTNPLPLWPSRSWHTFQRVEFCSGTSGCDSNFLVPHALPTAMRRRLSESIAG